MIQVKEIPLSKMLKMETKTLVNEVILIFERHKSEVLRLQDFYKILEEQKTKVDQLIEPYGKHMLTKILAQLHQKRLDYASLILMKRNAFEKVDNKETHELAITMKWLLEQFLANLARESRSQVTIMLEVLFSNLKMDNHAEVLEAIIKLDLQHYLNDLEKTNKKFKELRSKRSIDIKNRPPAGNVLIEREAQRILRLFFWQINTYQQTFKEIDYAPLISELNVLLTAYSKNIKTRVATNKRRARKKAEAAAKLKEDDNSEKNNPDKDNPRRENS